MPLVRSRSAKVTSARRPCWETPSISSVPRSSTPSMFSIISTAARGLKLCWPVMLAATSSGSISPSSAMDTLPQPSPSAASSDAPGVEPVGIISPSVAKNGARRYRVSPSVMVSIVMSASPNRPVPRSPSPIPAETSSMITPRSICMCELGPSISPVMAGGALSATSSIPMRTSMRWLSSADLVAVSLRNSAVAANSAAAPDPDPPALPPPSVPPPVSSTAKSSPPPSWAQATAPVASTTRASREVAARRARLVDLVDRDV